MYIDKKILVGKGSQDSYLLLNMANRHGLIAGATGTGKSISLKVLAESFSEAGVPVFLADVKGDLSSLMEKGQMNEKLDKRIKDLSLENFKFKSYPVRFWDILGDNGLPIRTTISQMGPILLARLLDLNETQSSILSIVFKIADDMQMLLLDYKDLKEMVQYISKNKSDFKDRYGNLSTASLSAILRKIIAFEEEGANTFFGEEALDVRDLIKKDGFDRGYINIVNAQKLYQKPKIYSSFLLFLLSELFEELEEVGDMDKPKLVFFFDEAHLLFDNSSKVLLEKIEQVVRLIRSKGVGIYFVTQNPNDIPDNVLGQLGNKIQHALRAFTPKEQKAIKAISQSFRADDKTDIAKEISNLKVGQALVSFLDEEGRPCVADIATIVPPSSKIGTSSFELIRENVSKDILFDKYSKVIDTESAYEILRQKVQDEDRHIQNHKEKNNSSRQGSKKKDSILETGMKQITRSMTSSFGRQIGKELFRGLFGSLTKKR